jgi:hypothetical protein
VGVSLYFRDHWNKFDATIVVISITGVLLDSLTPSQVTVLPLIRVFRVARILRLVPRARSLRNLLKTLLWCVRVGSVAVHTSSD